MYVTLLAFFHDFFKVTTRSLTFDIVLIELVTAASKGSIDGAGDIANSWHDTEKIHGSKSILRSTEIYHSQAVVTWLTCVV